MRETRPLRLARLLRAAGAEFTVVGGAARYLAGDPRPPSDLDIVVAPGDLGALASALHQLGVRFDAGRVRRLVDVRVDTSYGPVDVFVRAA